MTDIIDKAAMALSAGLMLLGIVGMGILEVLVGAPYGPVPLTNEAGDVIATRCSRRSSARGRAGRHRGTRAVRGLQDRDAAGRGRTDRSRDDRRLRRRVTRSPR